MKIRLCEKVFVSLTIWALLGVLFFAQRALAIESGYELKAVSTISSVVKDGNGVNVDIAYLWHPVDYEGKIYVGSYILPYALAKQQTPIQGSLDNYNQRIYYSGDSFKTVNKIELPGTGGDESARPHVLGGKLYFISEGGCLFRPPSYSECVKINGGNFFFMTAGYFNGQALFSSNKSETSTTMETAKLFTEDGKEWGVSVPDILAFGMTVFDNKLYLIGCLLNGTSVNKCLDANIYSIDSNKKVRSVNVNGAMGCYQGIVYKNELYFGCSSYRNEPMPAAIWKLNGNILNKVGDLSVSNFGNMVVYNDILYASGANYIGRSEIWSWNGSDWKNVVSQSDFEREKSDAGNNSGLYQPGSMLVVSDDKLFHFDNHQNSSINNNRYGPSYLFQITTPPLDPPSCTIDFSPSNPITGETGSISWKANNSQKIWIGCNDSNNNTLYNDWVPNLEGSLPIDYNLEGGYYCTGMPVWSDTQGNYCQDSVFATKEPICTLSFNPTEIDSGGKSIFSWTTTGEISKAWLSCDLAGSGEIGEILKTNPSGTVDWVANSTETEVCNLYLNSESATGNPSCSTSPGLMVKSDNNCQLDTCEGNSCWNGTSYVSGTKTEGCSTVTANFSSASDSSGEIVYLNWSAKEASALKFSCDGPVAITRTDFFLSSELWRSKAVITGLINSTSNFRGFPVRFNVGAVGMEVCTFYPVNASDGKMGIPKSIIIQLGEGLNCECGRNVSLGEDVCAEGEICNGCHCVQTRDRRRTICKPDNPSCEKETCQDLYCFNGCRYIQGTKDCAGRR